MANPTCAKTRAATYLQTALLVAVCIGSTVSTTFANRTAGVYLTGLLPGAAWIAQAGIPAMLLSLALYLAIRPQRPLALPSSRTPTRELARLARTWLLWWLLGSVVYAAILGYWPAYTVGTAAIVAFVITGPLNEELLFRGVVFELLQRRFALSDRPAILVSSLLFSVHHLQLHGFRVTRFVLFQLAFTFLMGWVLARLRQKSDSIWPGYVVHVLTNLPHAFGSPPGS